MKPDGVPTLTAHLVVKDAAATIALYEAALGARELYRVLGGDGRVLFCEMLLGDSRFFVVDEYPEQNALAPITVGRSSPVALHVYVSDVDACFERAAKAGLQVEMPPADFFWGERYAQLRDSSGHVWAFASRIEDLSPQQVQDRAARFYRRDAS